MTRASSTRAVLPYQMALGLLVSALVGTGCATTATSSNGDALAGDLSVYAAQRQTPSQQDVLARQLLVRGMALAYRDDHEGAIEQYEEALRLAPGEGAILSALAASHEALSDLTSALYYAQEAVEWAPDNVYYHHHVAELRLAAGQADEARTAYDTLLARFPRDEQALLASAELLARLGDASEAARRYERLLEVVGDDPALLEEALELYLRLGDDARAEAALQTLIEQRAESPELRRMLGELYLRQGRQDAAAALFERALEQGTGDAETVLALSDLYRRQGEAAKADALLSAPVSDGNASAEALVEQARPLHRQAEADPEAAEATADLLQRALEQDPAYADALALLGTLRLRQGDYPTAAALLDDALAQDPRNPALWRQAAEAHLQAGDARRAADVADEGTLLFPGQPALLQVSGEALLALHQHEDARIAFEDALALLDEVEAEGAVPDEADPATLRSALSLLHARLGATDRAEALYREALGYDAPPAMALRYLALSLATRRTDLDAARRLAQRAVDLDPQNPLFMDALGWVHLQMDDLDEAERWIGRALQSETAPRQRDGALRRPPGPPRPPRRGPAALAGGAGGDAS